MGGDWGLVGTKMAVESLDDLTRGLTLDKGD